MVCTLIGLLLLPCNLLAIPRGPAYTHSVAPPGGAGQCVSTSPVWVVNGEASGDENEHWHCVGTTWILSLDRSLGENELTWDWDSEPAGNIFDGMSFEMIWDATSDAGEQNLVVIRQLDGGNDATGQPESLLLIETLETTADDGPPAGLIIRALTPGTMQVGIDLTDGTIDAAFDIGFNFITVGTDNLNTTELSILDQGQRFDDGICTYEANGHQFNCEDLFTISDEGAVSMNPDDNEDVLVFVGSPGLNHQMHVGRPITTGINGLLHLAGFDNNHSGLVIESPDNDLWDAQLTFREGQGSPTNSWRIYVDENQSEKLVFQPGTSSEPIVFTLNQDGKLGLVDFVPISNGAFEPQARLHIEDTGLQFRVGYDADNWMRINVEADGDFTFVNDTFGQVIKFNSADGSIGMPNLISGSQLAVAGEIFVGQEGMEWEPTDTTDCSQYSATGGGIYFDDSEGIFKKCEDSVLSDLGGAPFSASNLGGGLDNFDSMPAFDMRFNTFDSQDFNLNANLISIDDTRWLNEGELDTIAELNAQITDATLCQSDGTNCPAGGGSVCIDVDGDSTCEVTSLVADEVLHFDYDDDGTVDKREYKNEVEYLWDCVGDYGNPKYGMWGSTSMISTSTAERFGVCSQTSAATTDEQAIFGFGRTSTNSTGFMNPRYLLSAKAGFANVQTINYRTFFGLLKTDTNNDWITVENGIYFTCAPVDDVDGNGTPNSTNDGYWWAVTSNGDTDHSGDICATLSGVQCATYTATVTTAWNTEVSCNGGTGEWTDLLIEMDPDAASVRFYVNGTLETTITTNIPTGDLWALAVVTETEDNVSAVLYIDYLGWTHAGAE